MIDHDMMTIVNALSHISFDSHSFFLVPCIIYTSFSCLLSSFFFHFFSGICSCNVIYTYGGPLGRILIPYTCIAAFPYLMLTVTSIVYAICTACKSSSFGSEMCALRVTPTCGLRPGLVESACLFSLPTLRLICETERAYRNIFEPIGLGG